MNKILLLIFILSSLHSPISGQTMFLLKGKIINSRNERPVENTHITIGQSFRQAATDTNGNFKCMLPSGTYTITIRHIEYSTLTFSISILTDTIVRIPLLPTSYLLSETVIRGDTVQKKSISGILGGRIELNMEELSALPKFMGTNDPLKILQLMPGVQTAGECNSGIFVRGGEPGHNLILWNDAPIYNASHLLGFFSLFNTGHIKSFKLHKSHMDAEYGGRLSSLITVGSPTQLPEKCSVEGSIGLISSQATVAIPIARKCALFISGRTTYIGYTLKPLLEATIDNESNESPFNYEFQDANFTFLAHPSDKDQITLNAFWGSDRFNLKDKTYALNGKIKWSNLVTSLSWQHQWSETDQMKLTFFMTQYKNELHVDQNGIMARLPSSIRDLGYRNTFNFTRGPIAFTAGTEYIFHQISPQTPKIENAGEILKNSSDQLYYTHELSGFASGDIQLSKQLSLTLGLRYSANIQTGSFNNFIYNTDGSIADSIHYNKGELCSFYNGFEPRVALRYTTSFESAVQLSYNRHKQYVNLVTISGVGLPTDFWAPSSRNIPPQVSDNFAIGYFQSLQNNQYEFSAELYYRKLQQQMEYNSTLFDLFNQKYILEKSISYGEGQAYGSEFMIKKNVGKYTGWISYTLGWSKRNFPDINDGKIFPAKHDRRHDLSISMNYKANDKWDFGSVFVYATGNAFTMPIGIYTIGGNIIKEYGDYNSSRLPSYHRLDISVNYWFFKNKKRECGLNFSVYNAYKHKNPMYVFVVIKSDNKENSNQIHIKKKYKQLYDIVPSISWTFRF